MNEARASDATGILVVDDDPGVREFLSDYLTDCGYVVHLADSAEAARGVLAGESVGLVLLDVGLPGEDGLALARHLREHHDLAIIMISGAGEPVDRIIGLEVGADDYLAKPFEPRELRARVKSVLRRYQRAPASPESAERAPTRQVAFGPHRLDLDRCQLIGADGKEIPVTSMEFALLRAFAERPDRPLSRDQLMTLTRNREWDPFDRSIDIRIARLRRKIEANPEQPQIIRTVRGIGYMFVSTARG